MTGSRPARALRGATVVLVLGVALRIPAIEHRFAAALRATLPPRRTPRVAVAGPTTPILQPVARVADRASVPLLHSAIAPAARASVVRPPLPPPRTPLMTVALSGTASPLAAGTPPLDDAGALATAAYARLAAGDRRGAVRLFDAALDGDDPRRPAWQRQRDALTRHWSGSAYSIVRAGGDPALAVTPVLGGGQSGAALAFTPDPLSRRPWAVTVRGSLAHDDAGRSAFAAVGLQWHPFAGVTVAAERLIAIGPAAPNAWTARLAAGIDRRAGRLRLTAYGEGGIVDHAAYAAVQGRAAAVFATGPVELDPGVGTWSSLQHDRGATVDRLDVGPGVVARYGRFAAEVDYRFRVAGNAAPGSGPVLTLSAAF